MAGTWQSSAIKGWHPYLSAEAMASVSMDESMINEIFLVWWRIVPPAKVNRRP